MKSLNILFITLIFLSCLQLKADEITFLGKLKGSELQKFNEPFPKTATNFIQKLDSTYENTSINKYDSIIENYKFQNELSFYKSTSPYTYQGNEIQISGLIIKPTNNVKNRDIIYFHGTNLPLFFMPSPSDFDAKKKPSRTFYELHYVFILADLGYTVFVPDYIGYTTSKKIEHPYTIIQPNIESTYDWYKSAKANEEFQNKNKIICGGVSEGGAYSLGFQKYIETQQKVFKMSAGYHCEGPYDYQKTLDWIFDGEEKTSLGILFYTWSAYSQLNYYFPDSHVEEELFKMKNISQNKIVKIRRVMTKSTSPYKYINEDYTHVLLSERSKEFQLIDEKTSVYKGWKPKTDIHLFQGHQDEIIPIVNAEVTYKALSSKSKKVHQHLFADKGHITMMNTYFGYKVDDLME